MTDNECSHANARKIDQNPLQECDASRRQRSRAINGQDALFKRALQQDTSSQLALSHNSKPPW